VVASWGARLCAMVGWAISVVVLGKGQMVPLLTVASRMAFLIALGSSVMWGDRFGDLSGR
jgi:hypothetical protein